MAHNFRLTTPGAVPYVYYSKSGHDSNDGSTPDTPKKTVAAGNVAIIGAGVYTTGALFGFFAKGDGKVILNGNASNLDFWNRDTVENIEFVNYKSLGNITSGMVSLRKCIFRNIVTSTITINASPISLHHEGGVIINSLLWSGYLKQTIVINTTVICYFNAYGYVGIENSYIDAQSEVELFINATYNPSHFVSNSNVQGVIAFTANSFSDNIRRRYAIQDQLIGTPQDNGYDVDVKWLSLAQLIADGCLCSNNASYQTMINTCINRDPLFNNVSIEDFTLQAGSPHIGGGVSGVNIGGTNPAISIYNTSNGTSQIIPSPQINTLNPNSYTVADGFTEGYIDYIEKIGTTNLVLKQIDPISSLEFNSDVTGGSVGNRNVPDSEPLTFEYPRKLTTTSLAANTTTINVTGHDVVVGEYVRYAGQDREVTVVDANTITVASAFRAAVPSGVTFQVGEKVRIGALNPNRLTFMMRTSKVDNPQVDSDWDNDIDPVYGKAGFFLTQEWGQVPGYYIDSANNAVWGSGDSERPLGLTKNEISCKWVQIRVYIRNNYQS